MSQSEMSPKQRYDAWVYVIESLIGGLSDEGILKWLNVFGPDLRQMVAEAEKLREGMVAT